MIRRTAGSVAAARKARQPAVSRVHGSSSASAVAATVAATWACTPASTARNRSALPPGKWWYSAPFVTPAARTISARPTAA
jgi:hypothetical protein